MLDSRRMCLTVKHLPSWFPGAGFKRKAAVWKAQIEEGADAPFQWMKDRLVSNL